MDNSQGSRLLTKLPSELRIKIYEYILTFNHPIKLRQIVSGSVNTYLLRANKQIYQEALAVLHEINTVSVTRNDFCCKTDPALETPVNSDQVRHLRIASFGESIACNFLLDRCAVCEKHGRGLLEALGAMPQLKTVTVDYSTQTSNFSRFRDVAYDSAQGISVACVGIGMYQVRRRAFDRIDFTFQHRPLASIWPAFAALSSSLPSEWEEEDALTRLRSVHADVPDKLWLLFCVRQYGRLSEDAI